MYDDEALASEPTLNLTMAAIEDSKRQAARLEHLAEAQFWDAYRPLRAKWRLRCVLTVGALETSRRELAAAGVDNSRSFTFPG